jgi:hypothetical protein
MYTCFIFFLNMKKNKKGMHQFDPPRVESYAQMISRTFDLFERHPVAPFMSIHHPQLVFSEPSNERLYSFRKPFMIPPEKWTYSIVYHKKHRDLNARRNSKITEKLFFQGLRHNPVSFLQLTLCELPPSILMENGFTAAVVSGLSVRLWKNKPGGSAIKAVKHLAWAQGRVDVIFPPGEHIEAFDHETIFSRYVFANHQPISFPPSHLADPLAGAAHAFENEFHSRHGMHNHNNNNQMKHEKKFTTTPAFSLNYTATNKKFKTTISVYEPENCFRVEGSGCIDHLYNHYPYVYIIVAEEQSLHKWLGAPRSSCHVGSEEVKLNITHMDNRVSPEVMHVLMLAVRDCAEDRSLPPVLPTKEVAASILREIAYEVHNVMLEVEVLSSQILHVPPLSLPYLHISSTNARNNSDDDTTTSSTSIE